MKTYHELPYQQLNLQKLILLVLNGKGYPETFLDTIRSFSLCNESCESQNKSARQKDKRQEAWIERAAVHANSDENARATWPQLIPERMILSCIEAYHANVQYKRLNVTDPYILHHTPTWRFTYIARTLDGLMLNPEGFVAFANVRNGWFDTVRTTPWFNVAPGFVNTFFSTSPLCDDDVGLAAHVSHTINTASTCVVYNYFNFMCFVWLCNYRAYLGESGIVSPPTVVYIAAYHSLSPITVSHHYINSGESLAQKMEPGGGMFRNASHFEIHGGQFIVMSNDEEQKIKDWLKAPKCGSNYTSAFNKKTAGTGAWILKHQEYIKWNSSLSSLLWIQGKAGSGKTILLTMIIEDLSSNTSTTVLYHYFDFRDNSGAKSSYQGFLLSLLQQMGFDEDTIHSSLQRLYQKCKRLGLAPPTNSAIEDTLNTIIQERPPGYIIIDALDECTKAEQVQVLKWLASHSAQFHIAITCRYPPYGIAVEAIRITLDDIESGIYQDISTFVEKELQSCGFNEILHMEVAKTSAKPG
ncbi:hypothetical protein BT96DRAFT_980020 [Gymnopus androsaceus JB14]|uniref:NACHT domain-containing protein n=1 Tax=Gymnopus androsaceus JB14 TaxID=1447944 RepID=A0A6A4H1F2_9AGAR|nr:hypothetical protein BT96DRAFT_980020 [Gymnopus androsaceus JB14]